MTTYIALRYMDEVICFYEISSQISMSYGPKNRRFYVFGSDLRNIIRSVEVIKSLWFAVFITEHSATVLFITPTYIVTLETWHIWKCYDFWAPLNCFHPWYLQQLRTRPTNRSAHQGDSICYFIKKNVFNAENTKEPQDRDYYFKKYFWLIQKSEYWSIDVTYVYWERGGSLLHVFNGSSWN